MLPRQLGPAARVVLSLLRGLQARAYVPQRRGRISSRVIGIGQRALRLFAGSVGLSRLAAQAFQILAQAVIISASVAVR